MQKINDIVETENLFLIPLTYIQLTKYLDFFEKLEEELGLRFSKISIPDDIIVSIKESVLPNLKRNNSEYLYYTIWVIVSKEHNGIVGNFNFKGKPNIDGEIEIGYETFELYRMRGFMFETLAGIINWLKYQDAVEHVLALTHFRNTPSNSLLEKIGFKIFNESDVLAWKIDI